MSVCIALKKTTKHSLKRVVINLDLAVFNIFVAVFMCFFFVWHIVTQTQDLFYQNRNVRKRSFQWFKWERSGRYFNFAQSHQLAFMSQMCFWCQSRWGTLMLWCFFLQDEISLDTFFYYTNSVALCWRIDFILCVCVSVCLSVCQCACEMQRTVSQAKNKRSEAAIKKVSSGFIRS